MMDRSGANYGHTVESNFFTNIIEKIKMSQDKILQYGIAAGVGFLIGFLIKKFSSYIAVVIAICLAITIFSHFGVINIAIDWAKMQTMIGIEPVEFAGKNIFDVLWDLVRLNVVVTLSGLTGFFIGLKIG